MSSSDSTDKASQQSSNGPTANGDSNTASSASNPAPGAASSTSVASALPAGSSQAENLDAFNKDKKVE